MAEFYLAGSLEKVFWNRPPERKAEQMRLTAFQGEIPALQLVYWCEPNTTGALGEDFWCEIKGFPAKARLRDVEQIPSALPVRHPIDDNYLTTEPGLFPDLLKPKKDNRITPVPGQYRSLWIDFPQTEEIPGGVYDLELVLSSKNENKEIAFSLEILAEKLPPQKLIHTQWFHADCLADYYRTEVFSDLHWSVIEQQIKLAGELGINMLLTPVFTPPLDTEVGKERTTVQLVDISCENGRWSFGFEKLEKWCSICQKYGVEFIEIPHLFTQWGAKATPKIVVKTESGLEKRFGWHISADDPAYRSFLQEFLPALQHKLLSLGYRPEQIYFHISDEPGSETLAGYKNAKAVVGDLLNGFPVIDALSDYDFYEKGLVEHPVPSNSHIQPFIEHGVPNLWTYYCVSQRYLVPNRFFAMPSARNRIMGVLMYLYNIKGFLHWGYNFYNSMLSREHINPFLDTHSSYAFSSGDSFLVYPGADGKPWSSIRAEVQRQALYDLRALELLESRIGREAVEQLIYEGQPESPFTFEHYPQNAAYLYHLRLKIADKLK